MKYLNINHHKKIIDLSQRHLIPARIKEYAFHIYDRFSKYQPCNRDEQLCKFLLYFAERKLRSAPANSSYFLKTNAEEEKRQGSEALRNGKKTGIPYERRLDIGWNFCQKTGCLN